MKKSILAVVIAASVASFVNSAAADTGSYITTPVNVTNAQAKAHAAGTEYHAALNAFNAAPASERSYAAQRLATATNAYQTAVIAEKVAIKDWLHPQASAAAPAAQDDTWKYRGETPAKFLNEKPAAVHYKEPQNLPDQATPAAPTAYVRNASAPVATPVLIAPQAVPDKAPVSSGYREPQNLPAQETPAAPTPYVRNAAAPVVHYSEPQNLPDQQTPAAPTAYVRNASAPVIAPTIIAPQAVPDAAPSTPAPVHYKEPQNLPAQETPAAPTAYVRNASAPVATPVLIAPQAAPVAAPSTPAPVHYSEPQNLPAQQTPATPAAYVRNGAPVAVHGSEPQNLPDAVAPKAPVVVKDEGYGAPKEVHLLSTTTHAQAATVEIATPVVTTIAPTAKATTAPTTTTVAQASATTTGGAGGAPAANTPVISSNQANVLLTQKANQAQQAAQQAQTLANAAQTTATGAQTTATTNGQNLQSFQDDTNKHFADLDKAVSQNRKRASAGIAGVAAMANIPQVLNSQTFAIGAGVGTTDGETGLAVGFSARASEHTTVKAAVSNDTQHNFVVGAGVSYGW